MENIFSKLSKLNKDIASKLLSTTDDKDIMATIEKMYDNMFDSFEMELNSPFNIQCPAISTTNNNYIKHITINDLNKGDIIVALRIGFLYLHYGVYVGDGYMVHFSYRKGEKMCNTRIIKTSYEEFANGSTTYREPLRDNMKPNSSEEIARIAESYIGENFGKYNLFRNNCEHFANYCRYNKKVSYQIEEFWNPSGKPPIAQRLFMVDKFSNQNPYTVLEYITNSIIIPRKYEKITVES
ncbi:MAG: lecithin retinol acyltransferase family protein [Bacteroidales bacterium]|nr:lecithin retinol acyltransferase family protein [Bacteroidales bacterium]